MNAIRSHRMSLRLPLVLALLASTQCSKSGEDVPSRSTAAVPTPPRSTELGTPAVVDFGPCTEVRIEAGPDGPLQCRFDHRRDFHLWLSAHLEAAPTVTVDGSQLPMRELEPLDSASRGLALRLPQTAQRLTVESRGETWTLRVRSDAQTNTNADTTDPLDAMRDFYADMTRDGLPDGWQTKYDQVQAQLGKDGWVERQLGLSAAVVNTLVREHRFDEAARTLDRIEPTARRAPRLQAMHAYSAGQLHWRRGQFDEALAAFRTASLHAMRVADSQIGSHALPMYADLLAELGYVDAALRWSQQGLTLVREQGQPCLLASTLRTVAWMHLLLRQQGSSNHDPEPMLREALELSRSDACPSPERVGGATLSLAKTTLWQGRPRDALDLLEPADALPMIPDERVRALDVELAARLALGQDRSEIESALARLEAAAGHDGTIEPKWYLAVRTGQALEARGDKKAAIEAFGQAEDHLDTLARLAGLGVGRSAVGTLHRESSERMVDLLRTTGRAEQALCVARQTEARRIQSALMSPSLPAEKREHLLRQGRAFRAMQEEQEERLRSQSELPADQLAQARTQLAERERALVGEADAILAEVGRHVGRPSCDALHQPEPGELLLGLFPRGNGWVLFAHDDHETTHHAVELRELDLASARVRLSELLLRPIAPQLRRARRLRVHAVGQAQRIEFSALPWDGAPLITHMPVVYGVDVTAPEPGPMPGSNPRAVLVADPTGSLPEAEQEIHQAATTLGGMGWTVRSLDRHEARPHVLTEQMAGVDLLHYAGHARHDDRLDPRWWPPYPGGTPSWPASLTLGGGTQLAAPEILMRSGHVPPQVILSGCRTGAVDTSTTGMSLAVAFLVAGSRQVLATSTVTADTESRGTLEAVVRHMSASGPQPWSLAEAFAQSQSQRATAAQPLGHYRVWVR